jgi:CBS domain containing-hemolysin-like protein
LDTPDPDPYASIIAILLNTDFVGLNSTTFLGLAVLLLLLFFSAMVSGSETAYFSLKPSELHLLENSETESSKAVLAHREHPKTLLATILIANNLVNVAIVILSSFLTQSLFRFSENPLVAFLVQIVAITSLILLIGEIIPKVIANKFPLKLATIMARPLSVMVTIFKPFSHVLVSSTSFIEKRLSRQLKNVSISDLPCPKKNKC